MVFKTNRRLTLNFDELKKTVLWKVIKNLFVKEQMNKVSSGFCPLSVLLLVMEMGKWVSYASGDES